MNNDKLWQTKLAARLHDPGEKALVLFRDRVGHEGGTVKYLRAGFTLEEADEKAVERADWWASAADRPQWPKDQWAQVIWSRSPVLIHPVSSEQIDLADKGGLMDTDVEAVKARSFDHFSTLAEKVGRDLRRSLLAFWRFGPELAEEEDNGTLGKLWEQLPADSRVPDHSIWEHLDLTSAFAGAFAADPEGEVALLALSVGPVQPFIASARSTSDLWAGSHLLSRLAWEVMKPVAEALGPDAILFPRLRGVPQVDLWLRDECGLPDGLFGDAPWKQGGTDANPLFAAALPNRFVALVPASRVRELAESCERAARAWLRDLGKTVVDRLLDTAGEERRDDLYCYEQMRRQLRGFPEMHWAGVPFALIHRDGEKATEAQPELSTAMEPFFGEAPGGFLASEAWQVLSREIEWGDGTAFFQPNPGVLYPAIYDLAERVLAAAKSVRAFEQTEEKGWRCSLTGETEWLTTDPAQLEKSYRRQGDTLWAKVAARRPAWAKKGEHLGALPAIKRLWPTLFAEEVGEALGKSIGRFVVSTHTMALAHQLDRWLEHGGMTSEDFAKTAAQFGRERVALPQRLLEHHREQRAAIEDAGRLVALMERAGELDDAGEAEDLRRIVRDTLKHGGDGAGFRLETYYGLLMMDGDHMGAILSGDDEHAIAYRDSFHPKVRQGFDEKARRHELLARYGRQKRAVSPGRHMAISGALNDFALHVVPHIVQREYLGRLIYAGGDDVLAMLPVADLLPAAARLRDAWSGTVRHAPRDESDSARKRLRLEKGYAWLQGRRSDHLFRMMGANATASAGLVVAHHQTPLARVLREVRVAEKAAKEGGRNAFHIRILKRSGGALRLTLGWEQADLLQRLVVFLRDPAVSRRAVYNTQRWLKDLPPPEGDGAMLAELLAYQLARQSDSKLTVAEHEVAKMARQLAALAGERQQKKNDGLEWLENLLSVAEFLARETRATPAEAPSRNDTTEGAAA